MGEVSVGLGVGGVGGADWVARVVKDGQREGSVVAFEPKMDVKWMISIEKWT